MHLADSRLSGHFPRAAGAMGPPWAHHTCLASGLCVQLAWRPLPEMGHHPPAISPSSRGSGGPGQFKNGRRVPIGMFHPADLPRPVWQDLTPCSWFSWKLVPFLAMATA